MRNIFDIVLLVVTLLLVAVVFTYATAAEIEAPNLVTSHDEFTQVTEVMASPGTLTVSNERKLTYCLASAQYNFSNGSRPFAQYMITGGVILIDDVATYGALYHKGIGYEIQTIIGDVDCSGVVCRTTEFFIWNVERDFLEKWSEEGLRFGLLGMDHSVTPCEVKPAMIQLLLDGTIQ